MLTDEDFELYFQNKKGQQGKPFYIPGKKQLLLYSDADYYEETPEVTALKTFIKKRFELTDTHVSAIFEDILYFTKYYSNGLSRIMHVFETMGLVFESEVDLQPFVDLYQQFNNNARMPFNRGYTPNEIFQMYPSKKRIPQSISLGANIRNAIADGTVDIADLCETILTANLPSEELRSNLLKEIANITAAPKNVGRNELCPCGSGKKYKKCCGREE